MSDKQIVSTPSLFKIDETFDDPRFMKVRIKALHSGENYNKSDFTPASLKKAKDSFANIPILANIVTYTDEDGNEHMDYNGHDMHKESDAFHTGEKRVIFDEKVVGVVPENCDFEIEHDDSNDKDYCYVSALIYRDYGNYCADILEERGGTTSVSAEVEFLKTSYDVKRKFVVVEEFRMNGITLLGEDVEPAMEGANASVFSLETNSRQEQLVDVMKELTEALNKYTATFADNSKRKEEKDKLNTELFNKLCEQYSVSESDITFEYSELDDEALQNAFAEHFDDGDGSGESGESGETESSTEGENTENSGASDGDGANSGEQSSTDGAEEGQTEGNSQVTEQTTDEQESEEDQLEAENSYQPKVTNQVAYSLTNAQGETHTFAVSMNDTISALTELFNVTYGEEDNDWYCVEVYGETKTVVAHGWYKHFKQKYTVKDGVYSLKGERTEVFAQYLTQEEIEALEGLKAKFAETSDKLALYESEPEKIEVLSSEDYALIKDTEEYKELSKRDNYFNLSKEELTSKLDGMLNAYAKELGKKNFSVDSKEESKEEKSEEPKKDFFAFARIETKSSFLDGLLGK